MEKSIKRSVIRVVLLHFIFIGYGVRVGSCYPDRHILQEQQPNLEQPYRTAFHFQPLKNWMNGTWLVLITVFLVISFYSFNFLLLTLKYIVFLFPWAAGKSIDGNDDSLAINSKIQMVNSSWTSMRSFLYTQRHIIWILGY